MPKTLEFIIISGWIMLLISCFAIVGATAWVALQGMPIDSLEKIAAAAMGFLFGSVPAFLKDIISMRIADKG